MIQINPKNEEKINSFIAEKEGKARERKVEYSDIVSAIAAIEKKLGIPKKCMEGITAEIDIHAQDFPNAYKWRAESTQITILRKSSGWYLTYVSRYYTKRESQRYMVTLTEQAKDAIITSMKQFS